MTEEHSKTGDPAVGSTHLVGCGSRICDGDAAANVPTPHHILMSTRSTAHREAWYGESWCAGLGPWSWDVSQPTTSISGGSQPPLTREL